jgi:hypothetical protein
MTTDFTDWAVGDLVLTLDGREYRSRPPSVEQGKLLIALAVKAEIQLGLVKGDLPDDLAELIEKAGTTPLAETSLGAPTNEALVADGVNPETIRRMAVYGIFYWVRGKDRADLLAQAMWRKEAEEAAEAAAPKGRKASTSGRRTASGSRTSTGSTRTTGSRQSSSRQPPKRPTSTAKTQNPAPK